jgi:hypothetical protein
MPGYMLQLGFLADLFGMFLTPWIVYQLVTYSIRVPRASPFIIVITLCISCFLSWVLYGLYRA